jgi:hypothetical protein
MSDRELVDALAEKTRAIAELVGENERLREAARSAIRQLAPYDLAHPEILKVVRELRGALSDPKGKR